MQLLLTGQGILCKNQALEKRLELNLDYWDFSCEPIKIVLDSGVENLSSSFVFEFLKKTAYRCLDQNLPMSFNNPRDLTDKETGYFPLCVGPYILELDETNEYLAHHIRGAMAGWGLHWQRDRRLMKGPAV